MQAKTSSILAGTAALIGAMTGFVVLAIRGQDPTAFGIFASAVIIPTITTLLRQDKTQQDVAQIKERTNGPLDQQARIINELVAKVEDIGRKLEGKT